MIPCSSKTAYGEEKRVLKNIPRDLNLPLVKRKTHKVPEGRNWVLLSAGVTDVWHIGGA